MLNKYFSLKYIVIPTVLLALSACSRASKTAETRNIARVGEEYLTAEEAKQNIPRDMFRQDSAYALRRYRDQWIEKQLVLQKAEELELSQKKEVRERIKQARYEILRDALRRLIMTTEVDSVVSDSEVRRYFEANKEHFTLTETFVRFRHLKTPDVGAARAAKVALGKDQPWRVVAANYAANPNEAIRQAEEYRPLSAVLGDTEIMKQQLLRMSPGQISAIQRVNGVYHFVQLLDRREEGEYPDMDWMKEELKNWIIIDKRQRKFSSYLKNLYLKAQSDNEIDTFNVLSTNSNSKESTEDTLETN